MGGVQVPRPDPLGTRLDGVRHPRTLLLVAAAIATMGTNCVPSPPVEGVVTSVTADRVCVDTDGEERCAVVAELEVFEPVAVGDCATVDLKQPSGEVYRLERC